MIIIKNHIVPQKQNKKQESDPLSNN